MEGEGGMFLAWIHYVPEILKQILIGIQSHYIESKIVSFFIKGQKYVWNEISSLD